MTKGNYIITIDGPAGAGKSTIAKVLAKRLRFKYLDTGAIYRALTWKVINKSISFTSPTLRSGLRSRSATAALLRLVKNSSIKFKQTDSGTKVFLDGRNISKRIRTSEITNQVYHLAEQPQVRKAVLKIQRRLASRNNFVTEGRDVGSVVFPEAVLKFYLDAALSERARRRFLELQIHMEDRSEMDKRARPLPPVTYEQVLGEIKERDSRDKRRKVAPLVKPKGAICIDTTGLSINQVVHKILYYITQHPLFCRRRLK